MLCKLNFLFLFEHSFAKVDKLHFSTNFKKCQLTNKVFFAFLQNAYKLDIDKSSPSGTSTLQNFLESTLRGTAFQHANTFGVVIPRYFCIQTLLTICFKIFSRYVLTIFSKIFPNAPLIWICNCSL